MPFDEWMKRPEDEAAQGATRVAAPEERKVPERGKDEPEGAGRDSLSEPENKRRKVADPPFERDSTGVPPTPRKTTASSTAPLALPSSCAKVSLHFTTPTHHIISLF